MLKSTEKKLSELTESEQNDIIQAADEIENLYDTNDPDLYNMNNVQNLNIIEQTKFSVLAEALSAMSCIKMPTGSSLSLFQKETEHRTKLFLTQRNADTNISRPEMLLLGLTGVCMSNEHTTFIYNNTEMFKVNLPTTSGNNKLPIFYKVLSDIIKYDTIVSSKCNSCGLSNEKEMSKNLFVLRDENYSSIFHKESQTKCTKCTNNTLNVKESVSRVPHAMIILYNTTKPVDVKSYFEVESTIEQEGAKTNRINVYKLVSQIYKKDDTYGVIYLSGQGRVIDRYNGQSVDGQFMDITFNKNAAELYLSIYQMTLIL